MTNPRLQPVKPVPAAAKNLSAGRVKLKSLNATLTIDFDVTGTPDRVLNSGALVVTSARAAGASAACRHPGTRILGQRAETDGHIKRIYLMGKGENPIKACVLGDPSRDPIRTVDRALPPSHRRP
jgi:hypothetical protein